MFIAKVTQYYPDRAFGFAMLSDRSSVFFHISDIENRKSPKIDDMLEIGGVEPGKNGRPKAVRIRLLLEDSGMQS